MLNLKLCSVNGEETGKMSLTNDDMDDDDADLLAAVESAENPSPAALAEAVAPKGFTSWCVKGSNLAQRCLSEHGVSVQLYAVGVCTRVCEGAERG